MVIEVVKITALGHDFVFELCLKFGSWSVIHFSDFFQKFVSFLPPFFVMHAYGTRFKDQQKNTKWQFCPLATDFF